MTSDNYTCIENVEKVIHIALPFSYAGNQTIGLKSALDDWKCQYVQKLEGILIDYQNLTFVESVGSMIAEQPCVHYDIKATFSVFKPQHGQILKGVINKLSKTHVGCVVHKYINVSISLSGTEAQEITKFLLLDSEILFEITNVDNQRQMVRIRGKITAQCIELMKNSFPHWTEASTVSKHQYFDEDATSSNIEQSSEILESNENISSSSSSPKKKKRKKKNESISLKDKKKNSSPVKGHKKKHKRDGKEKKKPKHDEKEKKKPKRDEKEKKKHKRDEKIKKLKKLKKSKTDSKISPKKKNSIVPNSEINEG